MIRLTDGTIVNVTEEGLSFLKKCAETTSEIFTVEGYFSKSSGSTATISMLLSYDFKGLVKKAIQIIESKDLAECVKECEGVTLEIAQIARVEVLESLEKTLTDSHTNDTSKSATKLPEDIPGVLVSYSTGDIQLRGLLTQYLLESPGEKKEVKSKPKTIAKRWLESGTFRQGGSPGSILSISLREGGFRSLRVGEQTITSEAFKNPMPKEVLVVETKAVVPANLTPVDAIFVIDTTGSNKDNQPAIKKALGNMITLLKDIDVQVGFVFQGDYYDGMKVVQCYNPVPLGEAASILEINHDTHGGDIPEAYEVGMYEARVMSCRTDAKKLIIFVTDAFPHKWFPSESKSLSRVTRDFDAEYAAARAQGFVTHFLCTEKVQSLGGKWSKEMADRYEESQYMYLHREKDIPYVLAGAISAEVGMLETFVEKAKGLRVFSQGVEGALRVFRNRGSSERVMVTETSGKEVEILSTFTAEGSTPHTVRQIRDLRGFQSGVAFSELTASTRLKTPVSVVSVQGGKAWLRQLADTEKSIRVGPDAHGKIFVRTRNESTKTINPGESVLFLRI